MREPQLLNTSQVSGGRTDQAYSHKFILSIFTFGLTHARHLHRPAWGRDHKTPSLTLHRILIFKGASTKVVSATVTAEDTHGDRTYAKDVQDHGAVSPVLVCEDVVREFMESCKKGGEKKV